MSGAADLFRTSEKNFKLIVNVWIKTNQTSLNVARSVEFRCAVGVRGGEGIPGLVWRRN